MSEIKLHVIKPSVNNMTARVFIRATKLDFTEERRLRQDPHLQGAPAPDETGRLAESGPYASDSARRNQLILSSIRGADFLKNQTTRGAYLSKGF